MTNIKILEKFAAYAAARRAQDEIKRRSAEAELARQAAEFELVDAMVDAKVKSLTLAAGLVVSLRRRFDVSVNQENSDQVAAWLMDTTGDVAPFQKLVLYKPAVVKHLKDLAAAEKLDETAVPEFMNLKTTPGITVRGWAGASDDE